MTDPIFCAKFGGETPTEMYRGHKWKLCLSFTEKKYALQRKVALQSRGKIARVSMVKYQGKPFGYKVWWRNP